MYRFPWYLTLVSTNHASSNPGLKISGSARVFPPYISANEVQPSFSCSLEIFRSGDFLEDLLETTGIFLGLIFAPFDHPVT